MVWCPSGRWRRDRDGTGEGEGQESEVGRLDVRKQAQGGPGHACAVHFFVLFTRGALPSRGPSGKGLISAGGPKAAWDFFKIRIKKQKQWKSVLTPRMIVMSTRHQTINVSQMARILMERVSQSAKR